MDIIMIMMIVQIAFSFLAMAIGTVILFKCGNNYSYEKNIIRNIILACIVYIIVGAIIMACLKMSTIIATILTIVNTTAMLLTSMYVMGKAIATIMKLEDYPETHSAKQ